jgi:gamma-glutamylcyclotransferase (GGCT)/AIG2-like uncharacterized protein YtfP
MITTYFVYNNLKVHPFVLGDAPFPGFDLIAWDGWTYGTLWDRGGDAGMTLIGQTKVHGQVWKMAQPDKLLELEDFWGVSKGSTEPTEVEVVVPISELESEKVKAMTYILSKIDSTYQIVYDGKWKF